MLHPFRTKTSNDLLEWSFICVSPDVFLQTAAVNRRIVTCNITDRNCAYMIFRLSTGGIQTVSGSLLPLPCFPPFKTYLLVHPHPPTPNPQHLLLPVTFSSFATSGLPKTSTVQHQLLSATKK